ncbi:prolipoprotein diacylglyceryl transferase [Pseudactinotalea sp. Z1739]|uniref:prolipoprotein diacylglyceryl transferase n=1 Tax=Pseudactinotalea sp. Z1739 TaxID=3413028 RepID=UPI003C7D9581
MGQLLATAGIPSPAQGVWYLGPLPLRAYALAILTGILLASIITIRRYRARGGPDGAFADMLIVAVPAGIIGARIYHVLTHYPSYFGPGADPLEALYIWRGGLAIIGAIALGTLAGWLVLRRKGLRLAPMADAIAPALLVAQAVGRLGNYFNQELFGGPTDLPWGLQIDGHILAAHGLEAGTLVHPTFLYELIWNLFMAALLVLLDRRLRLGGGQVFALYVLMYASGRFWIEGLRMDPALEFAGIRLNAWAALGLAAAALIAFVVLRRRGSHQDTSVWLPGREPADEEVGEGHDDEASGDRKPAHHDEAPGDGESSPGDEAPGDGGSTDDDTAAGTSPGRGTGAHIDPDASTIDPEDVGRA